MKYKGRHRPCTSCDLPAGHDPALHDCALCYRTFTPSHFPMSQPVNHSFYGREPVRVHYGCLADYSWDMAQDRWLETQPGFH